MLENPTRYFIFKLYYIILKNCNLQLKSENCPNTRNLYNMTIAIFYYVTVKNCKSANGNEANWHSVQHNK